MPEVFELDRREGTLWRRPRLVMTQLESPDAAGWWQLTSSPWRAVHERERQPELIRPDFTSAVTWLSPSLVPVLKVKSGTARLPISFQRPGLFPIALFYHRE